MSWLMPPAGRHAKKDLLRWGPATRVACPDAPGASPGASGQRRRDLASRFLSSPALAKTGILRQA